MAFGTPGGDQQDQWSLQFFLAVVDFGVKDLQEAIDDPTLHSLHMPSSFYPRNAQPGALAVEPRFPEGILEALRSRGHRVVESGPWDHGRVLAITHDPARGDFSAAASPRAQIAYAAVLP
jgi:gamma-glutamyltranspeptidase/glutathione hydrolase